jgi:imidazolonepropionase-like amidohydrolase
MFLSQGDPSYTFFERVLQPAYLFNELGVLMVRKYLLCSLLVILGCLGKTKLNTTNKDSKRDQGPSLEEKNEWKDPEAEFVSPLGAKSPRKRATPPAFVIRNATVLTATGKKLENASIYVKDGRIEGLGDKALSVPQGIKEVDGTGKFVTPGLIDAHSHLGVYASPGVDAHDDGNEATSPVTAQVAAGYAYWPQDPQIPRVLAGGVTTSLILPGSANLIGGLGAVVEMRMGDSIEDVAFSGAPRSIKMACGENPKRVYGDKGGPSTRMGEFALMRATFKSAAEYRAKRTEYQKERTSWLARKSKAQELDKAQEGAGKKGRVKAENAPSPMTKDPKLEVLADVLDGKIIVQVHCYRASDIVQMLEISDEYNFQIQAFHHALEAYKVRDLIIARGIGIATWADWWGFKLEAFDGIPENAALFTESGGRAIIKSDSPIGAQHLNKEAAKAMYSGIAAGINITEDQALRWITANPAWAMGIEKETGTIEVGKRADLVLWNKSPFSVYARADLVWINGEQMYDRAKTGRPQSDFELQNSFPRGGEK